MRQKTLLALALATVLVLVAAIFLPVPGGTTSKSAETGLVFPTLKDWLGSATKLTVTGATTTLNLARPTAADGWTLADKGGYPVQENVIRPILAGLLALHTTEAKTERPKLYSRLDVDDPAGSKESKARKLELVDGNGASIVKLIIGRRRDDPAGADALYVRKPDEQRSWLAQPAFDVPTDALSWIDRKILDVDADKIKSVSLTPAGGKSLVLARDKPEDKFQIKDLPKDAKLKTDNPGPDIAAGFRYLDLLDVRPAAQVTAPLAATAECVTFDGLTIVLTLFDQDGGIWLEVTTKADDITKQTQGWAYKISDQRAKTLRYKLVDLLQPAAEPAKPQKPAR
jgi:hypothetical protein